MRIQVMHQTAMQRGQPREVAIILSNDDIKQLYCCIDTNMTRISDPERLAFIDTISELLLSVLPEGE